MDENNFSDYFKMKFKIDKEFFQKFLLFSLILSFSFIGVQTIFSNKISISLVIIELVIIFFFFRIINYIIFLQFKQYRTIIETIGYFVVNELIMILDTSGSLKETVKFIILGNYPIYSNIFSKALILSHFGKSLESSLCEIIKKNLSGNIKSIFLNIIETWQNGKNVALLSKKRIINQISFQIIEETNKIESWASLSSGLIFLTPPLLICFLSISGKMNLLIGILILLGMIFLSFFIDPDRNLIVFSDENKLLLTYDTKSLEFLVILGENLLKGKSFIKSLNDSLNIITETTAEKTISINSNLFFGFKMGTLKITNPEILLLKEIFSDKIIHIISLIKKFSTIDCKIAGIKLLKITEELNDTNELLSKGNAKRKATKFKENIIRIFSLISLAFIAGVSPFFLYVSEISSHSLSQPLKKIHNTNFEIIYFIIAMVMSFLPIKKINLKNLKTFDSVPWRELANLSKFLLFLIIYFIVKSYFMDIYL